MNSIMKKAAITIASLLLLAGATLYTPSNTPKKEKTTTSILFYNVENLFDTTDDPTHGDNEYTPKGGRRWNNYKQQEKLNNLAKSIIAAGSGDAPEIVALAEIENRHVVKQLISQTPLSLFTYKIVHHESNDYRGIDVAIIYRSDKIEHLSDTIFRPILRGRSQTRDILLSHFTLPNKNKDTISIFVNHWVSRYGGYSKTQPLRNSLGLYLRDLIDSTWHKGYHNIIATGDFNDPPNSSSIKRRLIGDKKSNITPTLYNLSKDWDSKKIGTLKYRGDWDTFDQFIVSENLKDSTNNIEVIDSRIIKAPFLFEPDTKYLGNKPKRSYIGYRYQNGFSDHLPIILELKINI